MIWLFLTLYASIGVAHWIQVLREIGRPLDGPECLGALVFCLVCWPAFWVANLFD